MGKAGRRKGTVLFQLDLQPTGVWVSSLFLKLVKGSFLHNTTWDIISLVRLLDEELILSAQGVPIYPPLCCVDVGCWTEHEVITVSSLWLQETKTTKIVLLQFASLLLNRLLRENTQNEKMTQEEADSLRKR